MKNQTNTAKNVAWINLIINMVLAIGKLSVGFAVQSTALLSDGAHSVTDALSSVAVIIGIRLSSKHSDTDHPYGYERMECVAAVVLSVMVAVTGVGIGINAVKMLCAPSSVPPSSAGYAWIAPVFAVCMKEIMFRYTRAVAVRADSSALMADAWHQRTDALSSFGSLIGVVGVNAGVGLLDPLAGIVIALLIIKAALDIFIDAMRRMTDRFGGEDLERRVRDCAAATEGVQEVETLKTRLFGNCVLAEITVAVDSSIAAGQAYRIALAVRDAVTVQCEEIRSCSVHIHPVNLESLSLQN